MRTDALPFAFALIVLVLGAACEELLPKFFGVGFPVLLTVVQIAAVRRRGLWAAAVVALAAGALEDALSSLPPMTSASYFLAVAALIRWSGLPRAAIVLTYPAYQLWLAAWTGGLGGEVFGRMLLSFPLGVVTAGAAGFLVTWAERRAAVDESD